MVAFNDSVKVDTVREKKSERKRNESEIQISKGNGSPQ